MRSSTTFGKKKYLFPRFSLQMASCVLDLRERSAEVLLLKFMRFITDLINTQSASSGCSFETSLTIFQNRGITTQYSMSVE